MKKLTIALAVGALTLSMAAIGSADTSINVYGASAQTNFWSAQAQGWLQSPTGGGCTGAFSQQTVSPHDGTPAGVYYHGAKYYIGQAASCANDPNGRGTITVRVTAFDSYDGLSPVLGYTNPWVPDVSTQAAANWQGNPCTGNKRAMLNTTTSSTFPGAFACEPVNLGATDVTPDLLVQRGSGAHVDGPGTSGGSFNVNLSQYPLNPQGLNHYQPVVVPFAIWANKGVAAKTCTAGNIGAFCSANADCGTGGTCGPAVPLQSLSLDMVSQIFSGKLKNWNQFGAAFPNQTIQVCLRVPGSGTQATFDYSVMHRTGFAMPILEAGSGSPLVYFNYTTPDMMNCIDGNAGAIGIADADSGPGANTYGPISYAGYAPSRANIRNGLYDFYSIENLWENPSDANYASYHPLVVNFTNFANNPANIPSARKFWASQAEMLQLKSGTGYPTPRSGGAGSVCTGGTNDGAVCPATSCTGGGVCKQQTCANYPATLCP